METAKRTPLKNLITPERLTNMMMDYTLDRHRNAPRALGGSRRLMYYERRENENTSRYPDGMIPRINAYINPDTDELTEAAYNHYGKVYIQQFLPELGQYLPYRPTTQQVARLLGTSGYGVRRNNFSHKICYIFTPDHELFTDELRAFLEEMAQYTERQLRERQTQLREAAKIGRVGGREAVWHVRKPTAA